MNLFHLRRLLATLGMVPVLGACSMMQGVEMRPAARNTPDAPGTAAASAVTDHYRQGRAFLAAGHWATALSAFRRALVVGEEPVRVLNGMAIAFDGIGRPDLARGVYGRALAHDPGNPITLNNLARCMIGQHRYDSAMLYAERALAAPYGSPYRQTIAATLTEARAGRSRQATPSAVTRAEVRSRQRRVERTAENSWAVTGG